MSYMKSEKCIGLYLGIHTDGKIQMPTAASQKVFDKYCPPMSDKEMDHIDENLCMLSKKIKNLDMTLADEMLAFLRRDPDFEEGYGLLDDEEKAHLWLILLAQQDKRSLEAYL